MRLKMQTIILYKVVYVNEYGDVEERNYQNESDARNFARSKQNSQLFKTAILGEITEIQI